MRWASLTCILGALWLGDARAAVLFEIERLSAREARISGSGTVDLLAGDRIALINAIAPGPTGIERFDGVMTAGASRLVGTATESAALSYLLVFDGMIPDGASLTGRITATLRATDWAPIRTTGPAVDGISGDILGEYEVVVPIPVPSVGLVGLAASLAFVAVSRRRRS